MTTTYPVIYDDTDIIRNLASVMMGAGVNAFYSGLACGYLVRCADEHAESSAGYFQQIVADANDALTDYASVDYREAIKAVQDWALLQADKANDGLVRIRGMSC